MIGNFIEGLALQELSWLIGWFTLDTAIVLGAVAGAIFLGPPLRRLCIELAIVAAVIGLTYGKGVHDEAKLCEARQKILEMQATAAATARDTAQAKLAKQDESQAQAEIDAARRQDEENAHAAQQTDKNCRPITDRDLR